MRTAIRVPDLGLEQPIRLTLWLVAPGARVVQGERIVELLCGPAAVDLPAPSDGVLEQILVPEDHPVRVGQVVGFLRTTGTFGEEEPGAE